VGKYYEGTGDDVYRFQELDSEDEKINTSPKHGIHQVPYGQRYYSDELRFNDMDYNAWERRTSALDGMAYDPEYNFREEDEGYYDDAGEAVSAAEYEELLFRRVLDKIRVARATGDSDVQLSPDEIEAYQLRLHGTTPAVRSQPKSRPYANPVLDEAAIGVSAMMADQVDTGIPIKSRSKKSQPRTSLFSSKPKKEKSSSRKRATSNVSSASSQVPPGFVIPGHDGRPIYSSINPYPGSLTRDPEPPSRPASRSASGSSQILQAPSRFTPPRATSREVPGAFPGGFFVPTHAPRPVTPPRQGRPTSAAPRYEHPEARSRSPSIQPAKLVPFPIEPYQYQTFSPSSSSQPSPQLQYTRRPSAAPSEASYTSMPRRIPVPAQRAVPPTDFQRSYSDPTIPWGVTSAAPIVEPEEAWGPAALEVLLDPVPIQGVRAGGGGKDGERRRKGGKNKKKG
jgi:hypothetical protein